MPARRVFAWEPEEQWTSSEEREKKIEELSRELDESMDSNSGKGCLKAYLVKNEGDTWTDKSGVEWNKAIK